MLRRLSVFDDLSNLFRHFDDLFRFGRDVERNRPALTEGDSTAQPVSRSTWGDSWMSDFTPAVECATHDGRLVLRAELPGMDPKDIDVSIEGDRLTIRGEKKAERSGDEGELHYREISHGRFERTFLLPDGAKTEELKASYRDGLLEVTLPAGERVERKRIPVETGSGRKKIQAA